MNATFLDPCVLREARILASARPDPPSNLSPSWGGAVRKRRADGTSAGTTTEAAGLLQADQEGAVPRYVMSDGVYHRVCMVAEPRQVLPEHDGRRCLRHARNQP